MSNKKVSVVTGIGGQDGGLMVDHLIINTDCIVVGIARKEEDGIPWKKFPNFRFIKANITDKNYLSEIFRFGSPDYFFNFAAQTQVRESWADPSGTYRVNTDAVLTILDFIRLHCPHCRFMNAGSSEEFGQLVYSPQDELHPLKPVSPYGMSKVAARQLVEFYRNHFGIFAIQPWFFNHEGPRRGSEFVTRKITAGVANIYSKIVAARYGVAPWIELGNLNSKRDWSNAEDFIRASWMMINNKIPSDYVVASGESHTIKEFVEEAFKILGIYGVWEGSGETECFVYKDGPSPVPVDRCVLVKVNPAYYRPVELKDACGNSNRLRSDLKWEPKSGFFDIVLDMVEADYMNQIFGKRKDLKKI